MPEPSEPRGADKARRFTDAAQADRSSLVGEMAHYVRLYRRWSIVPILLALALLGAFVSLGSSGVAPFIYALF